VTAMATHLIVFIQLNKTILNVIVYQILIQQDQW
jgi:hypothetical protein